MRVLAIDPGSEQSAFVWWDGKQIFKKGIEYNLELMGNFKNFMPLETELIVEKVACYGMPVGQSIFQTVFYTGRFCEYWNNLSGMWDRTERRHVKLHICGSMRAKDSNIRQALIDRFGKPGTKKEPGLTYGLKKDIWQAFALAVYWLDTQG